VTLLDDLLPRYDVNEVHSAWVAAPPDVAFEAVRGVTAREIRLLGPLMSLRSFGRWRRAADPRRPVLDEMVTIGFQLLGERPHEEVVLGAVGRFWSPTGNRPQGDVDFATFAEPGYAKAALNFQVRAEADGARIVTETRVAGTDPQATRKFRRYWLVIRPASGAIRRSWLKGIERRLSRR
jgi:hypothetical protein